jgi:hypothetical protein
MANTYKNFAQEEHLTVKRLINELNSKSNNIDVTQKPTHNLDQLMRWAIFTYRLNNKNLQPYINNKITIDGSFLQFCEQNEVKVECLYRESIASWLTDYDTESFVAQGVFVIKSEDLSFIHCALFHKGNQNEDEVSFFVLVDDNDYEKYTQFRNKYDKWLSNRDRITQEVHVVGADTYPYSKDLSWDDLFLPNDLKNDIKSSVEGFLASKELYSKKKVPWRKGIILWGGPGLGKSLTIKTIISNYDFKPVTLVSGAETDANALSEAFSYASQQGPSLLFFEDIDNVFQQDSVLRHFLGLMDGVESTDGVFVVCTANDISNLKSSLTDRPRRFDRKWEFPMPDEFLAKKYLLKLFDNISFDIDNLVKSAIDAKFSYAYLQELYLSAASLAIIENKDINLHHVEKALNQLLSDKKAVKAGFKSKGQKNIDLSDYRKQ